MGTLTDSNKTREGSGSKKVKFTDETKSLTLKNFQKQQYRVIIDISHPLSKPEDFSTQRHKVFLLKTFLPRFLKRPSLKNKNETYENEKLNEKKKTDDIVISNEGLNGYQSKVLVGMSSNSLNHAINLANEMEKREPSSENQDNVKSYNKGPNLVRKLKAKNMDTELIYSNISTEEFDCVHNKRNRKRSLAEIPYDECLELQNLKKIVNNQIKNYSTNITPMVDVDPEYIYKQNVDEVNNGFIKSASTADVGDCNYISQNNESILNAYRVSDSRKPMELHVSSSDSSNQIQQVDISLPVYCQSANTSAINKTNSISDNANNQRISHTSNMDDEIFSLRDHFTRKQTVMNGLSISNSPVKVEQSSFSNKYFNKSMSSKAYHSCEDENFSECNDHLQFNFDKQYINEGCNAEFPESKPYLYFERIECESALKNSYEGRNHLNQVCKNFQDELKMGKYSLGDRNILNLSSKNENKSASYNRSESQKSIDNFHDVISQQFDSILSDIDNHLHNGRVSRFDIERKKDEHHVFVDSNADLKGTCQAEEILSHINKVLENPYDNLLLQSSVESFQSKYEESPDSKNTQQKLEIEFDSSYKELMNYIENLSEREIGEDFLPETQNSDLSKNSETFEQFLFNNHNNEEHCANSTPEYHLTRGFEEQLSYDKSVYVSPYSIMKSRKHKLKSQRDKKNDHFDDEYCIVDFDTNVDIGNAYRIQITDKADIFETSPLEKQLSDSKNYFSQFSKSRNVSKTSKLSNQDSSVRKYNNNFQITVTTNQDGFSYNNDIDTLMSLKEEDDVNINNFLIAQTYSSELRDSENANSEKVIILKSLNNENSLSNINEKKSQPIRTVDDCENFVFNSQDASIQKYNLISHNTELILTDDKIDDINTTRNNCEKKILRTGKQITETDADDTFLNIITGHFVRNTNITSSDNSVSLLLKMTDIENVISCTDEPVVNVIISTDENKDINCNLDPANNDKQLSEVNVVFPSSPSHKPAPRIVSFAFKDEVMSKLHLKTPVKNYESSIDIHRDLLVPTSPKTVSLLSVEEQDIPTTLNTYGYYLSVANVPQGIFSTARDQKNDKKWSYRLMQGDDKNETCHVNIQVIMDPTATEKVETETFEFKSVLRNDDNSVGDWVLVDCTTKEIKTFIQLLKEILERERKRNEKFDGKSFCRIL